MGPSRQAAAALRQATTGAHRVLDGSTDVVARLADPARREPLVRGYRTMHAVVEDAVAPYLENMPGLRFGERRRAAAIGGGGGESEARFAIGSRAAALGALYVIEGSTLGGRTILDALRAKGADVAGLDFMDPYGNERGAMWQELMDALERELAGDREALDEAISAALQTFALAGVCLGTARAEATMSAV
jgi:heme oxygenase